MRLPAVGLLLCLLPAGAQALTCPPFGAERPAFNPITPGLPGYAEADRLVADAAGHLTLEGAARFEKANRQVLAETISYQRAPEQIIQAQRNVWLQTIEASIQADDVWVNLDTDQARVEQARYWLNSAEASGAARMIEQHSATTLTLHEASFSTCPPQQRDWEITSGALAIDQQQGRATARNVVFRVADLPVAYTPYLDFPIDDARHSGLLMPTFGQTTRSGFEYRQPYYFNIQPNMDATLTPAYFSKRGFGLGGQWRRLDQTARDYRFEQQVDAFVLPDDRRNEQTRYEYRLQSRGELDQAGRYNLAINRVSDVDYFRDFGRNFDQSTTSHLESQFHYRNQLNAWQIGVEARRYQTVNPNIDEYNYPHRIMPRVTLSREFQPAGSQLTARGEFTRFEHPSQAQDRGERSHMHLRWAQAWGTDSFTITPAVSWQGTHYQLEQTEQASARNPNRALPGLELDSQLFLQGEHGSGRYQGALTPRVYYAYTPYQDQQDLPLFDTRLRTVSYQSYFEPNRFTGPDRISDINALTVGGDWTLIDTQQGTTPLSLRAAQRYYFQAADVEPRVAQGGGPILTEAYSAFTPAFNASISAEYEPDDNRIARTETRLGYRSGEQLANVSYYHEETSTQRNLRQLDLSLATPISARVSTIGRFGYDLAESRMVQGLVGVGFKSCCWRAQLAVERYLLEPSGRNAHNTDDYSTSIRFQIELKGLGNATGMSRFSDEVPGLRH